MQLLIDVGGLGGNLNARREIPRFRENFCPGTVVMTTTGQEVPKRLTKVGAFGGC